MTVPQIRLERTDSMPRIRLGISNCFAVKRWPEPNEWTDVIVDELGLDVYQFSLDLLPPSFTHGPSEEYIDRAKASTAARGLDVHSVFTGLGAYASSLFLSEDERTRTSALEWYEHVVDLAARLGARGAGGHVGALSVPAAADPARSQAMRAAEIAAMRSLADYASQAGLDHLLFENLAVTREPGHNIDEAAEMESLLAGSAVPWVLCLDLGHPAALTTGTPSDEPTAWLKSPWVSTPVVQLQQSSRGADSHASFTTASNRTGLVHREPVLSAIAGWDADEVFLFLEVIPAHEADDAAVLEDLRESVTYWREGIEQFS